MASRCPAAPPAGAAPATRLSPLKLLLQAATLLTLFCARVVFAVAAVAWALPGALLTTLLGRGGHGAAAPAAGGRPAAVFYEGIVAHARLKPVKNAFRYPVRVAVIDLDAPPAWFSARAGDFMTADEARACAGSEGGVRLLCNPSAAGYTQNPISVYYCEDGAGRLTRALAEVTNTPWGARVTFPFDPAGDSVPKALHVSPFMDMRGTWRLKAPAPAASLSLSVSVDHPEYGAFFTAVLTAARSRNADPNEGGGLGQLLRYGLQPHRVGLWIYWQAVVLVCKGVPLYTPPPDTYKGDIERRGAGMGKPAGTFTWHAARSWLWQYT